VRIRPPQRRARHAGKPSFTRRRAVSVSTLAGAVLLLLPSAAVAAGHTAHGSSGFTLPIPYGLFGISISGILKTLANDLFKVLAGALLPGWLKHAPQNALRWLIALPDPADPVQWPTMGHLEQDTTAVAVAFLPITLAVAAARYTASGVTGGVHHPAESLVRLVAAAAGLLLFPWGFRNAVGAVNVTTNALLSFAGIDHGLQRALTLMFAGGLAFGVTGPLVALLVIGAIFLAAGLFIVKVGLLALFAILFVAGPLALAGYPIPELHAAWRLLVGLLVAAAMIPIGWCIIFAVAGAISADITHLATPAAIGTRLVGFFAGLLTFFIAFRWPFFLISLVRARGLLASDALGTSGASQGPTGSTALRRAQEGRTALLAGAGTAGAAVSHIGGALGMPAGGLAGGVARLTARQIHKADSTPLMLRSRQGLASSWQSVRERAAQSRVSTTHLGRGVARAGAVAAATPTAVAAAARERGSTRARRAAGDAILENARSPHASRDHQPPAPPRPADVGGRTRGTATGSGGARTTPGDRPRREPGATARQAVGGAGAAWAPAAVTRSGSGAANPDATVRPQATERSARASQTPLDRTSESPVRRPRKRRPTSPSTPSGEERE
jgi:hypothetical protein